MRANTSASAHEISLHLLKARSTASWVLNQLALRYELGGRPTPTGAP